MANKLNWSKGRDRRVMRARGGPDLGAGPSVAAGFVHFVVASPGEFDRVAFGSPVYRAGDTSKSELTPRFAEHDVSGLHHVGEAAGISTIRHLP